MVEFHVRKHQKGGAEMTRWKFLFASAVCLLVSSVCFPAAAVLQAAEDAGKAPKAVIKTKFGDMEIVFFPDKAPNHVQNFVKLAKSGYYNGTIFHRVIPGFMIQGGDPNTKDPKKPETYGMGGPTEKLKAEFTDTPHRRGIVSMARTNDPNSAGSQFFIVVKDSNFLDGQYTVFGEVVKGMEVADKIVSLPRNPRDLPNERVEITISVE
jgi:peptidyl-prolyl cis-trans isomerase B (cyclophilin B)